MHPYHTKVDNRKDEVLEELAWSDPWELSTHPKPKNSNIDQSFKQNQIQQWVRPAFIHSNMFMYEGSKYY